MLHLIDASFTCSNMVRVIFSNWKILIGADSSYKISKRKHEDMALRLIVLLAIVVTFTNASKALRTKAVEKVKINPLYL